MKKAIKRRYKTVAEFGEEIGMGRSTVYEHLKHPEKWTLGQLRRARRALGLTREEMLRIVGWAI